MATRRPDGRTTDWHDLMLIGEGAHEFADDIDKGDFITVEGRLEYRIPIKGPQHKFAKIIVEKWVIVSEKGQVVPLEGPIVLPDDELKSDAESARQEKFPF